MLFLSLFNDFLPDHERKTDHIINMALCDKCECKIQCMDKFCISHTTELACWGWDILVSFKKFPALILYVNFFTDKCIRILGVNICQTRPTLL